MTRLFTLAILLLFCTCKKESNSCRDGKDLPAPLQLIYNSSTNCYEEGCKPYLQIVLLDHQKYYLAAYDIGALCDMLTNAPNYYDSNGIQLDTASSTYKRLRTDGVLSYRAWQCCK